MSKKKARNSNGIKLYARTIRYGASYYSNALAAGAAAAATWQRTHIYNNNVLSSEPDLLFLTDSTTPSRRHCHSCYCCGCGCDCHSYCWACTKEKNEMCKGNLLDDGSRLWRCHDNLAVRVFEEGKRVGGKFMLFHSYSSLLAHIHLNTYIQTPAGTLCTLYNQWHHSDTSTIIIITHTRDWCKLFCFSPKCFSLPV